MSSTYFSIFDMAICSIPALGIGIWQLVSVNREIARDKAGKAPSPQDTRHAIGEHGLDDR
jgi:hypothetical protein